MISIQPYVKSASCLQPCKEESSHITLSLPPCQTHSYFPGSTQKGRILRAFSRLCIVLGVLPTRLWEVVKLFP